MAISAVGKGAQDYFPKGDANAMSLARSIQYAIERNRRQQAKQQLNAAGLIQKNLFPKAAPCVPHYDIAARCEPAASAGGDYFAFFPLPAERMAIIIGDVAVRGVAPALIMSEARAVLRTLARVHHDPGEIVSRANEILSDDLVGRMFVTLFLARIDPASRQVRYAAAGHRAHLFDAAGRIEMVLKSQNPPLGVARQLIDSSSTEIPMEEGETLVLFTDGITESVDRRGVQFGNQRLYEVVHDFHEKASADIIGGIFEAARAFSSFAPQEDDMTAVVVKRSP